MAATLKKLVTECNVPGNFLPDGAEVFLTHTEDMPVSADVYWSAFRNFRKLQLQFEGHENLRLKKGFGLVGTVVSFYYDPTDLVEGQREMKLVENNDSTKTWRVEEAKPNDLYNSYEMTIKVEGTDTAKVTISVRFVSAIKDPVKRREDIAYHMVHLLGARIRDILNYVVREKVGGHHRFELEVDCSREKLWGTVGNFNDVSWIRESTHTVVKGIRRTIYFTKDRSLEVRLAWADSSDYLFVYEGDNSPDFLHCKYYRGRLQFFAVSPKKVKVVYDCSFLPAKDAPVEEFKKWFVPAIASRIGWLKEAFGEAKPSVNVVVEAPATAAGPPAFKKGAYSTGARGIVRGPLEDVWKVFRPFGRDCMEYWKIYDNMEIEEPGNDVQGCIRCFVTSKTKSKIRERLEWRDDNDHVEIYSLLSMEPPPPVAMTNVYTTITMTEVGEKETEVKFECTFDVSVSFAVSRIQDNQKAAYMACITGLQQLFHSEVGTLEVVVGSAADLARTDGWFDADPYVVLAVNDGKPVTTKVCRSTQKPIWDDRFALPVTSRTRNIVFTIMDRDTVGQDDIMGTANVNLDELTSGQEKRMTLDVQGGGTLNVRLYLKMHDQPKDEVDGDKLVKQITLPFLAPVFQSELDAIRNEFTSLITSFLGHGQKYELSYMTRLRTHPDVPLEEMPAACVPMPIGEMFTPLKAGRLMQRLMEFISSQAQIMIRLAQVKGIWDPWKANFSGYLPANERLIEEWEKDEEFCRQYLQGINPMLLTVCKDQSQIPAEMLELKAQGKTTEQLMAENRLFIVDYAPMLGVPATPGKFFYAPIVLLYKEQDGAKSRLNLLGIQLSRKKGENEVFSPETAKTHPNKYMFAKMHVVSADNNVHQFLYHLGYTHLAMEPIAVSLHTHLPPDHPVHRLLLPHFKDTIGINYLARHSLVSRIFPITDPMFATSTVGGLVMFLKEWRKYNFMDMAFPEELKRRGFDEAKTDGLENYFYRDDGFKLWNIYKTYVTGMVDKAYTTDKAVKDDQALQKFCQMIEGPGQLHGFPREISDKKLLIDCLTNIIFNVSAQHSAINFPQYDFYSFVPNRPAQLSMPMPDGPNDMLQSAVLEALPPPQFTALQVLLSYMLSMPSQTAITGVEAMKEVYPEVHETFNTQLKELSKEIQTRNEGLKTEGKAAYTYLDPENVAMSIDI